MKGDDVTTHELCEFGSLPKIEMEKFGAWTKRSGKTTLIGCYAFVFDFFMTLIGYYFHPMMKLLPGGGNDFQDANFQRSTG